MDISSACLLYTLLHSLVMARVSFLISFVPPPIAVIDQITPIDIGRRLGQAYMPILPLTATGRAARHNRGEMPKMSGRYPVPLDVISLRARRSGYERHIK